MLVSQEVGIGLRDPDFQHFLQVLYVCKKRRIWPRDHAHQGKILQVPALLQKFGPVSMSPVCFFPSGASRKMSIAPSTFHLFFTCITLHPGKALEAPPQRSACSDFIPERRELRYILSSRL